MGKRLQSRKERMAQSEPAEVWEKSLGRGVEVTNLSGGKIYLDNGHGVLFREARQPGGPLVGALIGVNWRLARP